ncbi:DUF3179 domain-containing (seleno)protein [Anabaena sp. UHCC 0451]|uniref:DUF3179 domain-containing (seleno)protein n=1 Tax=Anabaena sp. UHCC 0451 TaxID=2055235 RepID=UPI002B2133C9|nr:DUF3179 domain-containing (seleno)protein [Anabaena sp. UHCC 0451]MEA5577339.1 DUF3179 domain-containing (seleno)protein [Anabaena sp. UHCC 0451]
MKKNKFREQGIIDLPQAKLFTEEHLQEREYFRSLNEPTWCPGNQAQHMRPDDTILGLYFNDRAWALPWWIMKNHHIANLIIDGQAVLIALCEMCSSAAMFNAVSQGQRYTFRLIGLYNGTHFISDLETGSFWTSFSGESISGSLKGTVIERLPLWQLEWQQWLNLHPRTQVLYGQEKLREGHGSGHSPGSPGIGSTFAETLVQPLDGRLPHNTLVLGVRCNNSSKAYPLVELDKFGSIVNDTVAEQEIVIFHQPKSSLAIAFSPQLKTEILNFEVTNKGTIIDKNTGSFWNYTGEAYEGKLKGSQLNYVFSGVEEWYVWCAYNPNTEIFNNVGGLLFKLSHTIPEMGKKFKKRFL